MEYFSAEELVKNLCSINVETRYWMVRTMGGIFYDEFIKDGYIAIGYNEIKVEDLKLLHRDSNMSREILMKLFSDRAPEIENPSYYISQLIRFTFDLNVGDVVISPGQNSDQISFGIIESTMYEESRGVHLEGRCPFEKRIRVRWVKHTSKERLNPNLKLIFNSSHIITDCSHYSPYIDSLLNDFYEKDDEIHLVLRINKESDINPLEFFSLSKLFTIVDGFCQEYNIDDGDDVIAMKIQMESPGEVRLNSKNKVKMWALALAILCLNGGGIKIESIGLDISTKGLFNNINDYLDRKVDRESQEAITNALKSLEIKTPGDFEKIISFQKTVNEKRNTY